MLLVHDVRVANQNDNDQEQREHKCFYLQIAGRFFLPSNQCREPLKGREGKSKLSVTMLECNPFTEARVNPRHPSNTSSVRITHLHFLLQQRCQRIDACNRILITQHTLGIEFVCHDFLIALALRMLRRNR